MKIHLKPGVTLTVMVRCASTKLVLRFTPDGEKSP